MADELLAQLRSVLAAHPLGADAIATNDRSPEQVQECGETILRVRRHGKREELRVVSDEFCGKRFATVRVWFRDPEDRDAYLPTGRGVTVRRRELPAVPAALHEIASRLGVDVGERSQTESGKGSSPA